MTEWTLTVKNNKVVFQPKGNDLDFMVLTLEPEAALKWGKGLIEASQHIKKNKKA